MGGTILNAPYMLPYCWIFSRNKASLIAENKLTSKANINKVINFWRKWSLLGWKGAFFNRFGLNSICWRISTSISLGAAWCPLWFTSPSRGLAPEVSSLYSLLMYILFFPSACVVRAGFIVICSLWNVFFLGDPTRHSDASVRFSPWNTHLEHRILWNVYGNWNLIF